MHSKNGCQEASIEPTQHSNHTYNKQSREMILISQPQVFWNSLAWFLFSFRVLQHWRCLDTPLWSTRGSHSAVDRADAQKETVQQEQNGLLQYGLNCVGTVPLGFCYAANAYNCIQFISTVHNKIVLAFAWLVCLFLIWLLLTIFLSICIGFADILRMCSNASPYMQHMLHIFKSKVIAYVLSIYMHAYLVLYIVSLLIHGLILIWK